MRRLSFQPWRAVCLRFAQVTFRRKVQAAERVGMADRRAAASLVACVAPVPEAPPPNAR